MSTTRRSILAGLAALPAIAVPVSVPALSAEDKDADLMRRAKRVADLAHAESVAVEQRCDAEDRYEQREPKRPTLQGAVPGCSPTPEQSSAVMRDTLARAEAAHQGAGVLDAYRARIARVEAYEAERDALALRCGLRAAERKADRAARRLEAAARELALLAPTTQQGLRSKAAAVAAVFDKGTHYTPPAWLLILAEATIRDAAAIGAAA